MTHENGQDISNRRNIPRFFVEHPHISWILLLGVLLWGWFGYTSMPQRKDPDIPVRLGVAACPWPGATAQQVEQYITRIRPFIQERMQITVLSPFLCPATRTSPFNWMRALPIPSGNLAISTSS